MADTPTSRLRKPKKHLHLFLPAALVFTATIVVGVTLFVHTNAVMRQNMRQSMLTAAQLAAMRIPVEDLANINNPDDQSSDAFRSIAATLNAVRDTVPNARYVYIFKRTSSPGRVEFVVDADAILPDAVLDANRNGVVDPSERAALPGEPYDVSYQPELQGEAFNGPVVTGVYRDEWGDFITAFAPLNKDEVRGKYTLGIDMDARDFVRLSQSVFSPAALMLIALLAMLVAIYVALFMWRRKVAEERRIVAIRDNVVRLAMHQLGAPLASMQWWLSILRDQESAPISADKAEAFENIDVALKRSQDLLATLHRASSSADASLSNVDGVVSVADVCERVRQELQPSLAAKKQMLAIYVSQAGSVRLQPELLKGVVQELVRNAIDYSPDNTSILVRATRDKRGVTIAVSDSGCGISAAELPLMFGEFHRGKDAMKYKPVGNGLGLFVCKNIIEAAGGHIGVTSEVGSGTTVRFALPLA